MNIIISSLSDMKVTGMSQDLDSAKLFIAKSLKEAKAIDITLTKGGRSYPLIKTKSVLLDKADYWGYTLKSRCAIPDDTYTVTASGVMATATFIVTGNEELVDENEPIYIIGRNINPVTSQTVAQDVNSQQLTFYIRKKYDGISFIDDTKRIYADYIPVDPTDLPEGCTFISEPVLVISEDVLPPHGHEGEWLVLKWNLSPTVMKNAGTIQFAISVVDQEGDIRKYTWQTLPSSFEVLPNLAPRTGEAVVPDSSLAELAYELSLLQQDVTAIKDTLGQQTDEDFNNDELVIMSGGSASAGG